MSAARFELDPAVWRRDGGRMLVGGVPPRLLRLSDPGAAALDAILAGEPLGAAAQALARRLERHGLLHPVPEAGEAGAAEITVVIPVLDGGEALVGLVAQLAGEGPVIVVDDGSRDGAPERAAAAAKARGTRVSAATGAPDAGLRAGAAVTVIPNAGLPGPAGARNTGLRAARTALVAFLDADCEVEPGWRGGLAALLDADPDLALVAPRVRSAPGPSALARYEEHASPLDLGPHPSLVGPDRRIAYLPSAALLGRRADLLALGGFDETMRFGEDVDLVWRLLAAGHRARYVPSVEVRHQPRPDLRSFARQRAGYGAAAPDLARRHGGLASPLVLGPQTGLVAGSLLLGPQAFAPALAASVGAVASRGEDRQARLGRAEVALQGHLTASRHLARALVREWLPLSLLAATRSRRARRLLLAAAIVDAAPAWRAAANPAEIATATALRALDRAAYACGLWRTLATTVDGPKSADMERFSAHQQGGWGGGRLGALLPRRSGR